MNRSSLITLITWLITLIGYLFPQIIHLLGKLNFESPRISSDINLICSRIEKNSNEMPLPGDRETTEAKWHEHKSLTLIKNILWFLLALLSAQNDGSYSLHFPCWIVISELFINASFDWNLAFLNPCVYEIGN